MLLTLRILFTIGFLTIIASCSSQDCKFQSISPDSLAVGKVGTAYTAKIEQTSSCSYTAKSCTLDSGTLPPGLELAGDGTLTGTPTNIGNYTFTIKYEVCFGSGAYGATNCVDKNKTYSLRITQ